MAKTEIKAIQMNLHSLHLHKQEQEEETVCSQTCQQAIIRQLPNWKLLFKAKTSMCLG